MRHDFEGGLEDLTARGLQIRHRRMLRMFSGLWAWFFFGGGGDNYEVAERNHAVLHGELLRAEIELQCHDHPFEMRPALFLCLSKSAHGSGHIPRGRP